MKSPKPGLQYGALLDSSDSLASSIMTKNTGEGDSQAKALLEWLQQREDEMAALLAELVAIPTENPPGKNYRACADLLENRLKQAGLECERLEVSGAQHETRADQHGL